MVETNPYTEVYKIVEELIKWLKTKSIRNVTYTLLITTS